MKRRTFLANASRVAAFGLAARTVQPERQSIQLESKPLPDDVEKRTAAIIEAYDAQGNHRTGTMVDNESAEWLVNQVQLSGARASLEPFHLSRIDPQECYLRTGGRRIDGVPLFDGGFTGPEGIRGRLGPLGSDAEIALAESQPARLSQTDTERQDQIGKARRSHHKAIVVLTRGQGPGLFLLNASSYTKPYGPPALQISSAESEWLKQEAERRAEAMFVAYASRTDAQAFNVCANVAGSNPKLPPLVFMAPRSAWWQCPSEQGSRLVCWLETIRVLAAHNPARSCFFVALSGHELGFLGIQPYLRNHPDLLTGAAAWIFFGSDIGAPRQPNLIHASDAELQQWLTSAMEKEALTVNASAPHNSLARGETRTIQEGGARFVTLACASDVYHSVADRWPESLDVALLARYARAIAYAALELAR